MVRSRTPPQARHAGATSAGAGSRIGDARALDVTLAVIAKEPRPGLVKTRLTPPCTPEQAARLAEASLSDTLQMLRRVRAARHVCILDGSPGGWLPPGVDVVPQCDGDLGVRLAHAFAELGGPTLIVGMDTPQLTVEILGRTLRQWSDTGTDAVLGRATDGGYWCLGLRQPQPGVTDDVPMSRSDTGDAQLRRLDALGLSVSIAEELGDFDTFADATALAAEIRDRPSTTSTRSGVDLRFADAVAVVESEMALGGAMHPGASLSGEPQRSASAG